MRLVDAWPRELKADRARFEKLKEAYVKTTLLEALQICLYGSAAPALARILTGYNEHLRRRIHRANGTSSAAVELTFRHISNGKEHQYRAIRSWSVSGSQCRERFEVLRDGELDPLATDNWAEQVEEFLPARIASLFLFDGEKVESYADPEEAPALIATAVHNLLGLDIVERLSGDLVTLERKRRIEANAEEGGSAAATNARADLEAALEQRRDLQRDAAANNDALDRARQTLRRSDERYRREGGELYERATAIESEAAAASKRVAECEHSLREVAAGTAPLLLVADLVHAMAVRDEKERQGAAARQLINALREEHDALLALPAISDLPRDDYEAIEQALAGRRSQYASRADAPVHLDLDAQSSAMLTMLATNGLAETKRAVESSVRRARTAHGQCQNAERALHAVPSDDAMADLQHERAAAAKDVMRLEMMSRLLAEQLEASDRDIEQMREREARLAEQDALERFRKDDADRILVHSARVRGTLIRFREAVVARHVERIERLVLESFRGLVRKPGLLSDLKIDPANFRLSLTGGDGNALAPDQLSAGERQLLAVAILWGMAKASGRPLPTVIDTPLGRLDSEHRSRLVERYFPHASHQVLLLSTDEEISGAYHDALASSIGRRYRLSFDEARRRTVIEEGYLSDGGLRHVA